MAQSAHDDVEEERTGNVCERLVSFHPIRVARLWLRGGKRWYGRGMKLTIIGGGGFRVPQIIASIVEKQDLLGLTEVCLYDVDADRLRVMDAVVRSQFPQIDVLTSTQDLVEAVSRARVVFSAMRIGGTEGRVIDEKIALAHGVLGQETVGPGGLAYAMRTIPHAIELSEAVREHAPDAWVINFTNPAGIITLAMSHILGDRVISICDTPIGMVRRVAIAMGLSEDEIDYDYFGSNHLGWMTSLRVGGEEKLSEFLESAELEDLEEARAIGSEWIRELGSIPNEYLYYYYRNREAVAKAQSSRTRGEFLHEQQEAFYERALEDLARSGQLWIETMNEREATYMAEAREEGDDRSEADIAAGGYAEVAVGLIVSLLTDTSSRLIIGVGNGSVTEGSRIIPSLPRDCIVEVPCIVSAGKVKPQIPHVFTDGAFGKIDESDLGLLSQVKASESAIVTAAETADASEMYRGIAIHPLVDSVEVARELTEAYIGAHEELSYLR